MSSSTNSFPDVERFLNRLNNQTELSALESKMIRQAMLGFFLVHKKFFVQLTALHKAALIASDEYLLIKRRYRHLFYFDAMRAAGMDPKRIVFLEAKGLSVLFHALIGPEKPSHATRTLSRIVLAGTERSKDIVTDLKSLVHRATEAGRLG